jgi:hypothetical protein
MKRALSALPNGVLSLLYLLGGNVPSLAQADILSERRGLVFVGHPRQHQHALVVAVLRDSRKRCELFLGRCPCPYRTARDVDIELAVAGADRPARPDDGRITTFIAAKCVHRAVDDREQCFQLLPILLAQVVEGCLMHDSTDISSPTWRQSEPRCPMRTIHQNKKRPPEVSPGGSNASPSGASIGYEPQRSFWRVLRRWNWKG